MAQIRQAPQPTLKAQASAVDKALVEENHVAESAPVEEKSVAVEPAPVEEKSAAVEPVKKAAAGKPLKKGMRVGLWSEAIWQ